MKPLIFSLLLLLPLLLHSQLIDDFSDGDFTHDPAWTGDVQDFMVNDDFRLQLNAGGDEAAFLSTSWSMEQENEWRFRIKLSFSPSGNNFARVYLISDQPDLSSPLNGYFLQFGESGSDDAVELFRQQGEILTSVCRGTNGNISSSFDMLLRVRRNQSGLWTIETDPTATGAYVQEALGNDDALVLDGYLGVFSHYTSSNTSSFYFDDFYAGPPVIDTDPPQFQSVNVVSAHRLEVFFNEAVAADAAGNPLNYTVDHNIENPISAVPDPENPAKVTLGFDRGFINGTPLILTIQNMEDLAGNVAPPIEAEFVWYTPPQFGLLITEIMADPTPPVGLPEWEYLEIYNNTPFPVDLQGWKLHIGNTEKEFGQVTIDPQQYLICGDDEAAGDFTFSGPFYGFSSFALTNSGQTLVLEDAAGALIFTVSYTSDWYNNPNKADGGWSLELIDPANPCGGRQNWTASVSETGGTPGSVNSVNAENPDLTPPEPQRISIIAGNELMLYFSESIDSLMLSHEDQYSIDQDIGHPVQAIPQWPGYSRVLLILSDSLQPATIYILAVSGNLSDCAGNPMDSTKTVRFGLPQPPLPGDLVINEVLYNPKDDVVKGVDFVEIYNRSEKIIDMAELVLADDDPAQGDPASVEFISESGYLIFPGEYLVLTVSPETVITQYYTENPDGFLQMAHLPSYSNNEGMVVLATRSLQMIDQFAYSDDMQYALLSSTDGVSLERISFERPAYDPTNWHSAAETVGFATPAYQNSQYGMLTEPADPVTVEPEVFSPDNDGRDDVLNILCQFAEPGYTCNISIFDDRGREVRQLINNELLGTEATFSWDGLTSENQKAGIGIYIIFVEVFDLNGNTRHFKKTAVLATRL